MVLQSFLPCIARAGCRIQMFAYRSDLRGKYSFFAINQQKPFILIYSVDL